MSSSLAHTLCLALVAADLLARALRIQWLVRGLGHRMTLKDAFILNAFGDAACALTPLRIGGEPARLAGMLRTRVPATAAFVAIGIEVIAAWPVILVAAGWLAWEYAPAWWAMAGPNLARAGREAWVWVVLVVLMSVAALVAVRRIKPTSARGFRRQLARVRVYWRRMPTWAIVASVPMTLVNLVARVAILPVLALTLAHPPELGPMAVGSFALLYSQLILPTPSGAGAVDLGFIAGAAGDLGDSQALLLFAWRFYTSGIGVLLGLWLAVRLYGPGAIGALFGKGRGLSDRGTGTS